MNKIIIIILLTINTSHVFSQSIFIRPQASFGISQLYNKEDLEKNNKYFYAVPTFSYQYGAAIGYSFSKKKAGLQSISIGINKLPIKQEYKGMYDVNAKIFSTTILNYIQVPVHVEIALLKPRKLMPVIGFGFSYNSLRSYSDKFFLNVKDETKSPLQYLYEDDIRIYRFNLEPSKDSMYSWLYNKSTWMANASLGIKYQATKNIQIHINGIVNYNFEDVENKNEIRVKNIPYFPAGQIGQERIITPFKTNYSKYGLRNPSIHGERGASTSATTAFNWAYPIIFLLIKTKTIPIMNKLFFTFALVLFSWCSFSTKAQTTCYIKYTYDNSGNRIQREFFCGAVDTIAPNNNNNNNNNTSSRPAGNSPSLSKDLVAVFPSPNNGIFSVQIFDFQKPTKCTLLTHTGAVVFSKWLTKSVEEINIKHLASGNYFLVVHLNDKNHTLKILKE